MGARRLVLALLMCFCALAWILASGVGYAAAATQFGVYGPGSGQFKNPTGGAVVDATGDVYIADAENQRIDKFDASGNFVLAWGAGVANGANELQICTECRQGLHSRETGGFEYPTGIAVDNELASTSYGDVYVVDWANARVEKYGPQGEFLLMFGGHVNKGTGGNVCVVGESCQAGSGGTGNGEFSSLAFANIIAVGPNGAVYVGDEARVQIFEPSGTWRESISLAGLSSTAKPEALAVSSAGDVYVYDESVPGVHEFEPGGVEKSTQFDAGSTSIDAITVDADENLYVSDSAGGYHVLKYDSEGNELASFGTNTVVGTSHGLAISNATSELYAPTYVPCSCQSSVWILTPPPPGPLVVTESAIPDLRGAATLEAEVNPEGAETGYHFEYVDDAKFKSGGFSGAVSTTDASVASGLFEGHAVSASLSGLTPGVTYHYRLVASNSKGSTTGVAQSFEEIPPALIEGPWATGVAATSATIAARIDPLGAATEYRLEYGTSTSYGRVATGSAGAGESYVPISYHPQGLSASTVYHYRIVAVNEIGRSEGTDHTFTTQTVGGELKLADGRAWELVSPANKKGATIEPFEAGGEIQAANDGTGITYLTAGPNLGENPAGKRDYAQALSRRAAQGWTTQDLVLPSVLPEDGAANELYSASSAQEYGLFSPDLSWATLAPAKSGTPPLSPEATERTLYLRDNAKGTFLPLVTPANVPPETQFGEGAGEEHSQMQFVAATPDLGSVVFQSPLALTPGAIAENGEANLYEWNGGHLYLINYDAGGHPTLGSVHFGGNGLRGAVPRAMSTDGRRVAWTEGDPYGSAFYGGLYLSNILERRSKRVGGPQAVLQTMSSDGSLVFYTEVGELYVFDAATSTTTNITVHHGTGETSAGMKGTVLGTSEDGTYVYFVATGILASGAVSGEPNLYVSHDDGSKWVTTLIGTLSSEDSKNWYAPVDPVGGNESELEELNLSEVSSRVSPNGRYVAFMSDRPLTEYDNVDAVSGQPDEELFVYDATAGRLSCVSCDPTGARPVGVLDTPNQLTDDRANMWTSIWAGTNRWLAGSVPGWDDLEVGITKAPLYQPRYLLDNGRVFFDSPDALVPQDTNGLEDVYEYEPTGVGDCAVGDSSFSARSDGCVNLMSSGTSSSESAFYDASENGDDAFFITTSQLVPSDYDSGYDVYDAHVCLPSAPCTSSPVSSPPCTSGDSCKGAPTPQPEVFGPTPSATFSGTGNLIPAAAKPAVKPRAIKRNQSLLRALRACRKGPKRKRVACERRARKRYGAKKATNANKSGGGNR